MVSAQLIWSDGVHVVRSPIVIMLENNDNVVLLVTIKIFVYQSLYWFGFIS